MASFTIAPMRQDEYDACVELACVAFTTNNPCTVHTGVGMAAFRRFVLADCPREQVVSTGLSLVARGTGDGKPLAFLFLKTFALKQLPDAIFEHTGMQVSKELYEALYEDAVMAPLKGMCLGSMTTGKTLHAAMGGTAPGAEGRGIGKALRARAVMVARERGYHTLVVEPFHPATRHIWVKHLGGDLKAERVLTTFVSKSRVRGERPYEGVGGTGSICEIVLRRAKRDWPVFWPFFLLRLVYQAGALANLKSAIAGLLRNK